MKKLWRFLVLTFILATLITCFSANALAAEVIDSGCCGGEGDGTNLTWTLDSEGTLTVTGTGKMADYAWGASPWFSSRASLRKAIIGDGVTTIGNEAFSGCANMTTLTLPNSVLSIGKRAFEYCNGLNAVTIPNGVASIGDWAFYECSGLTALALPDSMRSIGDCAFANCTGLRSVTIPDSMTSIGNFAFCGCPSLTAVYFEGNAPDVNAASAEIASFDSNVTLYYLPGTSGWTDSEAYDAEAGTWNGYKLAVWEIVDIIASGYCGGEGNGTNLSWTLDSEGTLTVSGTGAMKDNDHSYYTPWRSKRDLIKKVVIGDGVTTIGDNAFSFCDGLTTVTIPDSVTTIGTYAFYRCDGLTTVTIGNSVTTIGDDAFGDCYSLTSVTLGDSVTTIGEWAFRDCDDLTTVTIPDSVTTIGESAFRDCDGLTTVTFGDSVTTIGTYAFYSCDDLTSVTLPDSVTSIGVSAFFSCYSLTTVTIGDSVIAIGERAFGCCLGLTSIEVSPQNEAYTSEDGVLFNKAKTKLIQYPRSNSRTSYDIPDSVTVIGDYAFYYCNRLKPLTLPDSVTTIGEYAFYRCYGLTSLTLSDSAKTIGSHAFHDCGGLTTVDIGDGVTTIGDSAFEGCGMTTVTIGDSVTAIGEFAFGGHYIDLTDITVSENNTAYCDLDGVLFSKDMTKLICYPRARTDSHYEIPEGVTTIGNHAFYCCESLNSVSIPDSLTAIENDAFKLCKSLTTVDIPDNVTTIGKAAFSQCSRLTSVSLGDSVTTIGDYAFNSCASLTAVYFEGNAPSAAQAFDNSPVTLYYLPGTSGWTDSEAYDAEAGTWNGYKLAVWDLPLLEGSLAAIEVSMDSELLLWLKFNLPEELVKDNDAYAVVTADKKGGIKETVIPMADIRAAGTDKNGRYVIEQGMAAPEMGRDVTVSFVDGYHRNVVLTDYVSGETADSVTRTVVDYAVLAMERGTAAQKNLNRALLTYGGYSQLYFGVDANAPVYNILLNHVFGVPSLRDVTADSIAQEMTTTGAALVNASTQQAFLDSAIYHRVYFTLNSGVSIDDLSFELTKRNKAGEYTETAQPVYESDKDRYYIQIDGIASPLLDYMYDLEIVDSSGNIQNVTTSVAAYLKLGISKSTNVKQVNMFKAMYYYNQIANDFFGF